MAQNDAEAPAEEYEPREDYDFDEEDYDNARSGLDYYETETGDPGRVKKFNKDEYRKATEGLQYSEEEQKEERQQQSTDDSGNTPDPPSSGISAGALQSIQIIAAIIIAGLLILFLVRAFAFKGGPANKRLRAQEVLEDADPEENLHEAPLDALLRKALEEKDYRQALRIYYLKIIKLLSEKGWINWKREKTNFDYLREMSSRSSKDTFRELTLFFELFWYGNANLSEEKYETLSVRFQSFINDVKDGTKSE